jgi:Fur family transcriptional regulator, peroxide stress response regulator
MINPDNPDLFKRLREHGLRPTKARRLLLAYLGEKNQHPNTDGIRMALRSSGYSLSIATLYQNLNKLVLAGLLMSIKGPDGLMHFDANLEPHHHFVCLNCNKMIDVKIKQESRMQENAIDFHSGNPISGWTVNQIKAELLGICPDCQ